MRRVVPGQVVPFIAARFGWVIHGLAPGQGPPIQNLGELRALVHLVEGIPDELLRLSAEDYAGLIVAVSALDIGSRDQGPDRTLGGWERDAIQTLHRLLQNCPDDSPAIGTAEPGFITDPDLRADLHRDIGEVNRALQNGEWKAATVLAGSVVEALLLWALQNLRTEGDLQTVATGLGSRIDLTRRPLHDWVLGEMIPFARAAGLISEPTKAIADQCRNFRNLIHPGKAMREAMKCNRSTALIGAGAIEAVIVDLK